MEGCAQQLGMNWGLGKGGGWGNPWPFQLHDWVDSTFSIWQTAPISSSVGEARTLTGAHAMGEAEGCQLLPQVPGQVAWEAEHDLWGRTEAAYQWQTGQRDNSAAQANPHLFAYTCHPKPKTLYSNSCQQASCSPAPPPTPAGNHGQHIDAILLPTCKSVSHPFTPTHSATPQPTSASSDGPLTPYCGFSLAPPSGVTSSPLGPAPRPTRVKVRRSALTARTLVLGGSPCRQAGRQPGERSTGAPDSAPGWAAAAAALKESQH